MEDFQESIKSLSSTRTITMTGITTKEYDPRLRLMPSTPPHKEYFDTALSGAENSQDDEPRSHHLLPGSENQRQSSKGRLGTVRRTKVSRACDECRRKKTRCDIDALRDGCCSACQKSGTVCAFERGQLKRGPTKRPRSLSSSGRTPPAVTSAVNAGGVKRSGIRRYTMPSGTSPQTLPGIGVLLSWSFQQQQQQQQPQQQQQQLQQPSPNPGQEPGTFPLLVEVACAQPLLNSPIPPLSHEVPPHIPYLGLPLDRHAMMVLSSYYQYWHPVFPILPDTSAELAEILPDPTLISAVAGAVHTIPIDHGGTPSNKRSVHIMTLLFVYLHTLDYTWLGAAVASAISAVAERNGQSQLHLYAVVVALDRLHALTHKSQPLVGQRLALSHLKAPPGINDKFGRVLRALELLPPAHSSEGSTIGCLSPPPEVGVDVSEMALHWLCPHEDPHAKVELRSLLPALTLTPLAPFIRRVI